MMYEEQAASLINRLDAMARDYDHYEYGLPISHNEMMGQMVEMAAAVIREVVVDKSARLQGVIDGLAARVAAQAELLARRAEKPC